MAHLHNKKQLEGRNDMHEEEAVDRITDLTDRLIHHILSFLEIKDVARTSVLSKRWNDIWKSVPTLDFISLDGGSREFMDLVDRVLHLHSMSNIKKLSLRCCCNDFNWQGKGFLDVARVNTWISGAIMRKVEELSLTLEGISQRKTFCPLNLFTCKSLKTLELNVVASYDEFYVPKHMSLPQLERLKLGGVTFSKKYNNELLSLSNCPVLKDLTLECCRWDDVRSFDISAPSIEHLRIISVPNDGQGDLDYSPGLRDTSLKIHAPKLVSLTYKEKIPKEFVLSSSLTLAEADVDDLLSFCCNDAATETREQQIGVGASAVRFLQLLSDVKVLSIADRLLEALSFADDLVKVMPTFNSLKQLNVSAGATNGKALVDLFRSAPILESLVFNELNCYCNEVDCNNGELNEAMTDGCCFLHLKTVCFKRFTGEHLGMWWVELILEKAKALQTMTIFHSYPLCVLRDATVKSKEEVLAGLSSLFRASATSCVLDFP